MRRLTVVRGARDRSGDARRGRWEIVRPRCVAAFACGASTQALDEHETPQYVHGDWCRRLLWVRRLCCAAALGRSVLICITIRRKWMQHRPFSVAGAYS